MSGDKTINVSPGRWLRRSVYVKRWAFYPGSIGLITVGTAVYGVVTGLRGHPVDLLYALCSAVIAVPFLKAARGWWRAGLFLDPNEVIVNQVWRTWHLPIADVKGFEANGLAARGQVGIVVLLHRHRTQRSLFYSGELCVWGLSGTGGVLATPRNTQKALEHWRQVAAELNEWLRRQPGFRQEEGVPAPIAAQDVAMASEPDADSLPPLIH